MYLKIDLTLRIEAISPNDWQMPPGILTLTRLHTLFLQPPRANYMYHHLGIYCKLLSSEVDSTCPRGWNPQEFDLYPCNFVSTHASKHACTHRTHTYTHRDTRTHAASCAHKHTRAHRVIKAKDLMLCRYICRWICSTLKHFLLLFLLLPSSVIDFSFWEHTLKF